MKQCEIVNAYTTTEELSKNSDLSVAAKWALYKLRKELLPHKDFYFEETKKLLDQYKTEITEDSITFESAELAREFQTKQGEIDDFEVKVEFAPQTLNISEVPNITVQQMEQLDKFITFNPD